MEYEGRRGTQKGPAGQFEPLAVGTRANGKQERRERRV